MLVFIFLNISWFLITNVKYNKFVKAIPKDKGGIHAVVKDGYTYNVKKPSYLHYTGNLGVANNKTRELLIIWPSVFGGYEHGFVLHEDGAVYEIYVDENMEPIDKNDLYTIQKIKEHKNGMKELLSRANEMWQLKYSY